MAIPFGQDDRARLERRDEVAMEQWFHAYCDRVYAYALPQVGKDADTAADVVQETFMYALQTIHKFDPQRGDMGTWLIGLSRNCIKEAMRQRRRYRAHRSPRPCPERVFHQSQGRTVSAPQPDQVASMNETAERVQNALVQLPVVYYVALRDYYYDHHSVKSMACDRSISEASAKSLLHRARQAFRKVFGRMPEPQDPCLERSQDER